MQLTKHGGKNNPSLVTCGGNNVSILTAFRNLDTTLLKNAGCPVRG